MSFLNTLRRFFHITEKPPATSGATSILFCLQQKSPMPMTMQELHDATLIPYSDLRHVLAQLIEERRIAEEHGMAVHRTEASKNYWIIYRHSDR